MKRHLTLPALFCLMLLACADSATKGKDEARVDNTIPKEAGSQSSDSKIRNGIQLQATGLKVSQAFLLYDDGTLVPPENVTNVKRPVKLRLIIDGGWNTEDGKVYIGASEKIETSDGQVVLNEKDLFSSTPYVTAEDARIITLTATISGLDKLYDYFLVSFRVWDKKGSGEVTGSYKLIVN